MCDVVFGGGSSIVGLPNCNYYVYIRIEGSCKCPFEMPNIPSAPHCSASACANLFVCSLWLGVVRVRKALHLDYKLCIHQSILAQPLCKMSHTCDSWLNDWRRRPFHCTLHRQKVKSIDFRICLIRICSPAQIVLLHVFIQWASVGQQKKSNPAIGGYRLGTWPQFSCVSFFLAFCSSVW